MSETINHLEMGELRWQEEWSWWFTQIESPIDGGWLDLIVDPGDGDKQAFLDSAGELFRWAMANQGRILREALGAELLELYNGVWRQSCDPELSADGLRERLVWTFLKISESELVPVIFSYHSEGELFGGHSVDVEVDGELRYRGCDLVG